MQQTQQTQPHDAYREAALERSGELDRLREEVAAAIARRDEAAKGGVASKYLEAMGNLAELRQRALQICAAHEQTREQAVRNFLEGVTSRLERITEEATKLGHKAAQIREQLDRVESSRRGELERVQPAVEEVYAQRAHVERFFSWEKDAAAKLMQLLTQ